MVRSTLNASGWTTIKCPFSDYVSSSCLLLHRLNPLNDHGRSSATAIADSSHAILARLQVVQEGNQDTRAGAAQRVAEGDGTTEGVDVGVLQAKNLG